MKRKYSNLSFNVDVDIELWELLEALSDDDLLEEVKIRELKKAEVAAGDVREDALREVWELLKDDDVGEALLVAERLLFPKYPSIEACEAKLKELRGGEAVPADD